MLRGPAAGSPRGCSTYRADSRLHLPPSWRREAGGGLTQAQGERGTMQGMGGRAGVDISIQSQHVPKTTFWAPELRTDTGFYGSQAAGQDSKGERNLKWEGPPAVDLVLHVL